MHHILLATIMIVAIAASASQKHAFEKKGFKKDIRVIWVNTSAAVYEQSMADICIDCLFTGTEIFYCNKPLLVQSTVTTLQALAAPMHTARFCCWEGFIERPVWELAIKNNTDENWLRSIMESMGWAYRLVKDEPGFITPRIISMVINEACFTLAENVSTIKDIDIAMKLGTNYPFGPFEWADRIGRKHIFNLLTVLAQTDKRYTPSHLLAGIS